MKIIIPLVVVVLALVAATALTTVRTIVPPIERTGDAGWLVTAPGADETGYAALPYLFAPERRGILSLLSGVALGALLVVSTAFGLYTIRLAYRGGPPARHA